MAKSGLTIEINYKKTFWFILLTVLIHLRLPKMCLKLSDKPLLKLYVNDKPAGSIRLNRFEISELVE